MEPEQCFNPLATKIYFSFKATTPCPLHNLPLSLIYSYSSLLITYCIGKIYDGIPHLHTLVRRSLSHGVESSLGTWVVALIEGDVQIHFMLGDKDKLTCKCLYSYLAFICSMPVNISYMKWCPS